MIRGGRNTVGSSCGVGKVLRRAFCHLESLRRFTAGIRNDKKLFFVSKTLLSLGAEQSVELLKKAREGIAIRHRMPTIPSGLEFFYFS